jgi:two-component system LytT family response regulator
MIEPSIDVLIVDDEPVARRGLRRFVATHPRLHLVGECRNGAEAVTAIRAVAPGLVLLDVQMPGLDGLGVVREVGAEAMPPVIFVTAHDDYAVPAFELAAVDYVLKPFTDERLAHAVARAIERTDARRAADMVRRLLEAVDAARGLPPRGTAAAPQEEHRYPVRFLATVGTRSVVVPVDEIIWIRADDYYASLITAAGAFLVREPLAELEGRLDPALFVRTHRSAIVRVDAVRSVERGQDGRATLVLRGNMRVPVSRSRRPAVLAMLGARD